jgi:hypothetical protein
MQFLSAPALPMTVPNIMARSEIVRSTASDRQGEPVMGRLRSAATAVAPVVLRVSPEELLAITLGVQMAVGSIRPALEAAFMPCRQVLRLLRAALTADVGF